MCKFTKSLGKYLLNVFIAICKNTWYNNWCNKEKYKFRYKSLLKSTIYTLLIVVAVSILVATLAFPVLQIYGESMKPNLTEDDIVLCIKKRCRA